MVATCSGSLTLYMLPMLLGRTYDMQHNTVGIDIYDKKDIDDAKKHPNENPQVDSLYMTIDQTNEKRDFLGISGELGIKISAGLVDIKGAGDYLKDTSNIENSVEILIQVTFITLTMDMSPDATPLSFWQLLDRDSVGTHVVTGLQYGGQVYASVKFVALKSEYMEDIKAQVSASIAKSGAFDVKAQGDMKKLSQNISSKAKMEISYFGTVPLEGVPTSIDELGELVNNFQSQVAKVNGGIGVPVCANFRPLEDFDSKFKFLKNSALIAGLNDFNYLFNGLKEAKSILKTFVTDLPEVLTAEFLKKLTDFAERLTNTLTVFYGVIGNLDLEKGTQQLSPAQNAYDANSKFPGDGRYTKEIKFIIDGYKEVEDDPDKPRAVFVLWGKSTCRNKASNLLFSGFMSSFLEKAIGSGTNYLCLPDTPNLQVDPDAKGLGSGTTKLGAVRYHNMSVFHGNGRNIEDKVAPCAVCETPMRPTVKMFAGTLSCPGDWVQEYTGYVVANYNNKMRAEFVCVDADPDTKNVTTKAVSDPVVLPIKMGGKSGQTYTQDASVPCSVCSK